MLLQRLDDGRYIPIRRPMVIDRMAPSCLRWLEVETEQRGRCSADEQLHHRVIESIVSDQVVDVGDEFSHGRTVKIVPGQPRGLRRPKL